MREHRADTPAARICYCTNALPAGSLAAFYDSVHRVLVPVRRAVRPGGALGLGLWFSAAAASEIRSGDALERLRDDLGAAELEPRTVNGFPQHDFHGAVVKHDVYTPRWDDPARLAYTVDLAHILARLIPEGRRAAISTVPVGWRGDRPDLERAGANLAAAARAFRDIAERTGRHLTLDLEPEPGCCLDTAADVVRFCEAHLFPAGDERVVRAHVGVCHDVCHAAVMGEGQADALAAYAGAGIDVNKVQVSSALQLRAEGAADRLARFAEPRYLHQTTITGPGGMRFFEDLPRAIDALRDGREVRAGDVVRVHFHVPIFLAPSETLGTTQDRIADAADATERLHPHAVYEIETYAWDVLPPDLAPESLVAGIAREIRFLDGLLAGRDRR